MRNLCYFIKEACISLKRNLSTSIGSTITIFLSLFLIGLFFITNIMVEAVVDSIENKVSITAYVSDDASDEDIQELMDYIQELEYVDTVSFTDKDGAVERARQTIDADTLDTIGDDDDLKEILPRSIDVDLTDPQQVELVASQIEANETFIAICDEPDDPSDSIQYGQRSVERLFSLTNIVRYAAIAVVVLLVFVTLVFINNTIRLAIMARRREISIMRLVGATKNFIRGPFVMEGIIQALIGSALAILTLWLLEGFVSPYLTGVISWLPTEISSTQFLGVSLILTIIGLLIGLFGSALAMRRYLKV